MKKDRIKNALEIISIVVPAIITILSTILDKILKVEILNILSLVFTTITLVFAVIVVIINICKENQHKKTIGELRQLVDICCDGKKYLSNDATVEFIKNDLSYKITICKKYEILSLDRNYYPLSIGCDKHPEDLAKSTAFYENQKDIWKDIDLHVSMIVDDDECCKRYDNMYFEVSREQNNHIYFQVFYQQIINNQQVNIPVKKGDRVTIIYTFVGSTRYWGSYINRPIDINRASTTVTFMGEFPDTFFTIITIDLNGNAKRVNGCEIKREVGKTIIKLPTRHLSMEEIKGSHFRIYWDANSIFGATDLNSQFVGPIDPIWRIFD